MLSFECLPFRQFRGLVFREKRGPFASKKHYFVKFCSPTSTTIDIFQAQSSQSVNAYNFSFSVRRRLQAIFQFSCSIKLLTSNFQTVKRITEFYFILCTWRFEVAKKSQFILHGFIWSHFTKCKMRSVKYKYTELSIRNLSQILGK